MRYLSSFMTHLYIVSSTFPLKETFTLLLHLLRGNKKQQQTVKTHTTHAHTCTTNKVNKTEDAYLLYSQQCVSFPLCFNTHQYNRV